MQRIKGSTLLQKDPTKRPCDSLTLCKGYTGTFGERGNVRQEICIAGRKKSLQAGGSIFPRGFVVLQVGAVNFVSDLQVCTPNNDIFPTKKPWSPPDFGEVGRVGCGYSCDFLLPMVWFHSRRHAENHRLKNRSAYSNERGIPYL